ncbi:hypothetical protein [Sphingomonas baiyangensis]|uniref:Uncharacterized protein n=1 Tax=Sphingomonas baiyangensis TaxID=2572576 RepID=A0A4U1L2F2_9SPHN|nr:hypothetical protein [Sphingomonas baiyangensis]TKD50195.1 hypothetical protein FBR43_05075 [Sphingomonas baiyangensis]
MANRISDSEWGKLIWYGIVALVVLWATTLPSDDQVCRPNRLWLIDKLHGVDGQPTCQQLIRQIEGQAIRANMRADEAESRLEAIEDRLNM